jgi:hypothetical protein
LMDDRLDLAAPGDDRYDLPGRLPAVPTLSRPRRTTSR